MQNLSNHGQTVINDLAQRYGISNDAVTHMLYAVMNGGGTMAQFNSPELGGGGQWMQGGMTMVGDMFNNGLKATVDNLCSELSNILANQSSSVFQPASSQSQSQGNGQQQNSNYYNNGQNSLFIANPQNSGNWWPDGLGQASSTGAQNNVRYAVFPSTRRLALDINGNVSVYDTLDHQIGGVSQQQGGDASLSFTSQYGLVQIVNLPLITGQPPQQAPMPDPVQNIQPDFNQPVQAPIQNPQPEPAFNQPDLNQGDNAEGDIFALIEKLADLRKKDILSEDEFAAKKAELLQRL